MKKYSTKEKLQIIASAVVFIGSVGGAIFMLVYALEPIFFLILLFLVCLSSAFLARKLQLFPPRFNMRNRIALSDAYDEELSAAKLFPVTENKVLKGLFYIEVKRYETAVKCLKNAIKIAATDRERAFCYLFLGIAYKENGFYSLALRAYKTGIALYDGYYKFFTCAAYVYMQTEAFDEAIEAFEKAKTLNPKSWLIYNNISTVYLKQQKYKDAIESAKTALVLNPSRCEPNGTMLIAYANLNDKKSVKLQYNQLVTKHYDSLQEIKEMAEEILYTLSPDEPISLN